MSGFLLAFCLCGSDYRSRPELRPRSPATPPQACSLCSPFPKAALALCSSYQEMFGCPARRRMSDSCCDRVTMLHRQHRYLQLVRYRCRTATVYTCPSKDLSSILVSVCACSQLTRRKGKKRSVGTWNFVPGGDGRACGGVAGVIMGVPASDSCIPENIQSLRRGRTLTQA